MPEDIVALTNEALPHMQVLAAWTGPAVQNKPFTVTHDGYFVFLDHVAAFKAIRNRAPECSVRDTWDRFLREVDGVIARANIL